MTSPGTLTAVRPPARSIESVLVHRWARVLIPSLSDLFFLAILAWMFMSGPSGWHGLLADGDVGWHIRNGEYILDHHTVPRHDLYSFSKPNAPWYAWEWLTDVLDGSLHRLAGLKAIVLFAGVMIAAFATTLVRRMVWRGTHLFVAIIVALLGVGAASIHFLARPHLFTLLLMSISIWMLEADRERPSGRIWWLVPITMVWTNLHGGFLALIAVLGLCAVGAAVEAWLEGLSFYRATRYLVLTGACAAASLVNPYGWGLHRHVIEYLRSDWIRTVVQEFQSPSFRTENMLQFEALMLAGLLVAGALFRKHRIIEGLWIVFFIHISLGSVRHVPVYVAVTVPVIAFEIGGWWKQWTVSATKSSLLGIINQMAADSMAGFRRTSAWPFAVIFALAMIGKPIPWPRDFPEEMFPVKLVHAHQAEILDSRLLTTDQWADYLIYNNPSQKVFVDGRSDFYGKAVGTQYLNLITGQWDWRQTLDKYDFNLALLPTDTAICQLLKISPEWAVVEDDGKRILLKKRPHALHPTGDIGPERRF